MDIILLLQFSTRSCTQLTSGYHPKGHWCVDPINLKKKKQSPKVQSLANAQTMCGKHIEIATLVFCLLSNRWLLAINATDL